MIIQLGAKSATYFIDCMLFVSLILVLLFENTALGEFTGLQTKNSETHSVKRHAELVACSLGDYVDLNCTHLGIPICQTHLQFTCMSSELIHDLELKSSRENRLVALFKVGVTLLTFGFLFVYCSLFCILLAFTFPIKFSPGRFNCVTISGLLLIFLGGSVLVFTREYALTIKSGAVLGSLNESKAFGLLCCSIAAHLVSTTLTMNKGVRKRVFSEGRRLHA